jgi:hypothetical protein
MACLKGGAEGVTHEVIGASSANSRAPIRTFTPALCSILLECPQELGFTVSQVHALLLHKLKTSPIHSYLIGQESIRLVPVGGKLSSSPTRIKVIISAHTKEVVVCIHLNEDIPPASIAEFLDFLAQKPELTRSGYVKLLDTRKADSTIILVILPCYLDLFLATCSMYLYSI